MQTESIVRRNFIRSSGVVFLSFFLNAGLNVFLLGWLAREGGIELVGVWSMLNVVLLYVLITDFGFTNSLTRNVSLHGVNETLPSILRLIFSILVLWVFFSFIGLVLAYYEFFNLELLWGVFLAGSAGCLQVISSWIVSIRLGKHQQFWFNIKTILRVVTQTSMVIILWYRLNEYSILIFGLALIIGGLVELLFTLWLVKQDLIEFFTSNVTPEADWYKIIDLGRGFGVLNLLQRIQMPIWQSMIAAIAGLVALGSFTVAIRIPIVLSQSISEAMRVLLPGLSQLKQQGDRQAILRMLRDGLLVQSLILAPLFILYFFVANDAYLIWLGVVNHEVVSSTRLIVLGVFLTSLVVPYFWALQAFGDSNKVALSTAIRLVFIVFVGGFFLLITDGSIISFSFIYMISSFINAGLILYWSEKKWGIVTESITLIIWNKVILFLLVITAIIFLTYFLLLSSTPVIRFSVVCAVLAFFCAAILPVLHKKKFFQVL